MRSVHFLYKVLGHLVCQGLLVFWGIRDSLVPPKSDTVLFVAHPDDDLLFFHQLIKEKKPYVCLISTGWSLRRLPCFMKAMKEYGVRYRCYDFESKDTREEKIVKKVRSVLALKQFDTVVCHSPTGEYGHDMHKMVYRCVRRVYSRDILVPARLDELVQYPLPFDIVEEKQKKFRDVYTSELFVLDLYADWVKHEHLVIDCGQESAEERV